MSSPYEIEIIILLNNRIQNLIQKNEIFVKLLASKTDYKSIEPLINLISEECWKWFCDISNPKNFITIDLKKKELQS